MPMESGYMLDYPYLIAHFHMETDTGVRPIVPTVENIAVTISNFGPNSDVTIYTPDGTELLHSDYDRSIERCCDEQLRNALLPMLKEARELESLLYAQEAEVDEAEWAEQYEKYYDGPYDHSLEQTF